MKKYWELTKPWKWLLFSFLVFGFWLLGWSKKFFFGFSVCKKPRRFIWGSIYSCSMDGFFRIFKKAVSELICTRLYFISEFYNCLLTKKCPINAPQGDASWIIKEIYLSVETCLHYKERINSRKTGSFGRIIVFL